jgi:hypothetical protein
MYQHSSARNWPSGITCSVAHTACISYLLRCKTVQRDAQTRGYLDLILYLLLLFIVNNSPPKTSEAYAKSRSFNEQFITDISGQRVGSIFKDGAVQQTSCQTAHWSCAASQKAEKSQLESGESLKSRIQHLDSRLAQKKGSYFSLVSNHRPFGGKYCFLNIYGSCVTSNVST